MAGPMIVALWNAIPRRAIALASRSVETSVGGMERAAGQPRAAADPAASASRRNGHSELAPASVTTIRPPATRPSRTMAAAYTRRRGNRSAM